MTQNASQNHIFANALNLIPVLGPVRLSQLLPRAGSFEAAWRNLPQLLRGLNLNSQAHQSALDQWRQTNPENEFKALTKAGISVLLTNDEPYPAILKEINPVPPLLYVRGQIQVLNQPRLAVVGTRKLTRYGQMVLESMIPELIQSNLSIVSGLAFGVDALALKLCLEHGAVPVAVLASSIDDASISPRANFLLAQQILERGCLVSEYPLGSQVQKQNFPVRNRLISGLSLGTLVIEAGEQSGALITAKYALEQNRGVMAVPGSIFSEYSKGTNDLIARGAKATLGVKDILQELNLDLQTINSVATVKPDSPQQQIVLDHLDRTGINFDELAIKTQLPASQLSIALSVLELNGRVKNLGAGIYAKIR